MPIQEAIFCCLQPVATNTGAGLIALHDSKTGTTLASFKPTNSASHSVSYVESRPGLGGIILAAQSDKPFVNVFNFQKDQLSSKIILGERLTCLALNYSGDYCAGGTSNGRIYLWEVGSGILFNTFEAHYRRISTLKFTRDGNALISASDDSSVSIWLMSRLLDEDSQSEIPLSYSTFTDHTLPVTDISCGAGAFPSCRVFSSSMDQSVKIWDLSSCSLLTSVSFPHPISILAVDQSERFIFAGSAEGFIYQFNLFRQRPAVSGVKEYEAVGGGGMSEIIRVDDEADRRLISVGHPITTMTLLLDCSGLLVGGTSGQIHIYDIASHQLLRSINTYKDKGLSVTNLFTLLKPIDLFGHINLGDGTAFLKENDPVRPVAQFHKTKDVASQTAHVVPLVFPRQPSKPYAFAPSMDELFQEHRFYVQSGLTESNGVALQTRVSELEVEVAKLRDDLATAKGINDDMWENIVQKILSPDDSKIDQSEKSESEVPERSKKRSRKV